MPHQYQRQQRRQYRLQRDRAIAYGTWESSIIPAGEVISHLRELTKSGRSRAWIAKQSGVTPSVLDRLLNGQSTRISRDNADKIKSVTRADKPTGKTYVPVTGARRRLEALAKLGHPESAIAAETGLTETTLWNIRERTDKLWVAACTHNAIAQAYEKMRSCERTDPAGKQVRAWASRKGFQPPRAWTQHTIDDAAARPLPLDCVV